MVVCYMFFIFKRHNIICNAITMIILLVNTSVGGGGERRPALCEVNKMVNLCDYRRAARWQWRRRYRSGAGGAVSFTGQSDYLIKRRTGSFWSGETQHIIQYWPQGLLKSYYTRAFNGITGEYETFWSIAEICYHCSYAVYTYTGTLEKLWTNLQIYGKK